MNKIALMKTNLGTIEIELFENVMPITTANFIKLAEEKFYDGIKFHRVIDGFMIQAGDPNTKEDDTSKYGSGGPGYTIADEFVEGELLTNVRGTIAMANTGQPNSGGSQFFINTVDNTGLDFNKEPYSSKHPVFGRITKGMDVVDAISNVETGQANLPTEPVIIENITIVEAPQS
ncbi:MAG: peptidylprolyl isomerase [Candidatus Pacebacteria bacterium]|nr:peptidylprolyl isomerase [Candidatus Paceibacterota bacterium]MCF7857119.1 peptidylprolyl isomerase [Candidatus Paceibacterota bacterium]